MNFEDTKWDGSASNWDTAEAYCNDCLIDLNTGEEKTKDKCKLPYRRPGSSAINKNALRAMASGARGLAAVDAPASAKRKAARWLVGVWKKAFGKEAPDSIKAMAASGTKTVFYKDKSGVTWFLGVYSNNFEDREGEILSWDAHQEYAKWFKEHKMKLPIIIAHQPHYPDIVHLLHYAALQKGVISPEKYSENMKMLYSSTRIGDAEAVIPINGFMLVVGKIDQDKIDVVERLNERAKSWGMSHSFIELRKHGNIINKYRTFEFTLAPTYLVANTITPIAFNGDLSMAEKGLTQEDRDLLNDLLNGSVDDLEEATKKARELLEPLLNSKTTEEDTVEEEVSEEQPSEYEVLRGKIFADLQVEELSAAFKAMGTTLAKLVNRMAEVEKTVNEVKRSEDERIAEYFVPDWSIHSAMAGEQGEDDLELLEELHEKADQTIVEEKTKDTDNPLGLGLWNVLGS